MHRLTWNGFTTDYTDWHGTFNFIADKINHQSVLICEICGETAFRFPALPGFSPSFL
ncbi:hypothetical protein M113_2034 [Bacteroides fragilis str. 3986 N3]|uniref:Uncharacterized protein n=3 Tax=Bacteroides fragilis TaxID=817 RepID=A0A015X3N0_BACFG|nr:hypothetical protein M077_2088 [Bacteroides fragilis str. 2-F-2 \